MFVLLKRRSFFLQNASHTELDNYTLGSDELFKETYK